MEFQRGHPWFQWGNGAGQWGRAMGPSLGIPRLSLSNLLGLTCRQQKVASLDLATFPSRLTAPFTKNLCNGQREIIRIVARSLLATSGWILLWLPGLIATDENRAWLVCMMMGLACVFALFRHPRAVRVEAMTAAAMILLTAYWASDLTWAAGWQQSALGWPTGSMGIAPFAGPVAVWLIVFAMLTPTGVLLLVKGFRKHPTISTAKLVMLSVANAGTCWSLYDRIGGV